MECPVCGRKSDTMLCPECGFDTSRDYEQYPTLDTVEKVPSVSALRKKWQRRKITDEPEKKPEKKRPWIGVAACAAMLVLGICIGSGFGGGKPTSDVQMQTPPETTEAVPEAITLKVWASEEDQVDESSWLIQVEKAFEEAHPEYDITWQNGVCREGDAAAMVTANVATAADVYMYSSSQLSTLLQAGTLAKLDGPYLEQVKRDVSTTYVNTVTSTDGGVYGFPLAPTTWFMYYNKTMLNEEDVKSFEACLEKGIVAFNVKNSWYLPAFFYAAGGTLFGETGTDAAAGIRFDGEIGINATNAVLDLMDHPNFRVDDSGSDYGETNLSNGTIAAYFSGSWDYAGLYEALGENLGAVPAPTVMINGEAKQLKAYANSSVVGVNPNAKNMKAAMQFAAFLASADSQLLRFQLRNITPAVTALAENPEVAASVVATAEIAAMDYASVAQPTIYEMGSVWVPMEAYGNSLANGTITRSNVAESVDKLSSKLNE